MKVNELMKLLSDRNPEEEICALIWTKEHFDFQEDDDLYLPSESWIQTVKDFEGSTSIFSSIDEWLSDTVIDYSVIKGSNES
jgi:hypothetical protein